MLNIICPSCQVQLKVPDTLLGRKAKCTKCGTVLQIPGTAIRSAASVAPATGPCPAARRPVRDEEPEDFEERPRPARRRKKSPVVLIALLSALGVVLVGGGVLAALYFTGVIGGKGQPAAMKYMPDNAPILISARIGDILNSDAWKEVKQEFPEIDQKITAEMAKGHSPPLSDFASVLLGGSDENNMTIVLETTQPYTAEKVQALEKEEKFRPQTVGAFTMYEGQKVSFAVDGNFIILGKSPTLRAVLERNGAPKLSDKMRAALGDVDMSKSIVVAMDVAAMPKKNLGGPGFVPGVGGFGPQNNPETAGVEVDIAKDVSIRAVMGYRDANAAQAGKAQLDFAKGNMGMLAAFLPKEVMDIIIGANVEVQGSKLITTTRFAVGPVVHGVKQLAANKFGGNPFGPPPINHNPFPPPGIKPPPQQAAPPTALGLIPAGGKTVQGQLTAQDGNDRVRFGSKCKRYSVVLTAGKTYQIDMVREGNPSLLDPYLRLEDAGGQQLAFDDDGGGFPNARIVFLCPKTDTYIINCTTFAGGTGNFTLTIRESQGGGAAPKGGLPPPPPPPLKEAGNSVPPIQLPAVIAGPGLTVQGELTQQDAKDLFGGYCKVYTVPLTDGKSYHIEMASRTPGFNTRVRLEDPSGKQLASGLGFGANAKINPNCHKSGTYRIICTSLPGKTGAYTLTVSERQSTVLPPGVLRSLNALSIFIAQGKERTYKVQFLGGKMVTLTLTPRPQAGARRDPNVTLIVYDAANNIVSQDLRSTTSARVQFTPAATDVYRVVIHNLGPGTARLTIQQR